MASSSEAARERHPTSTASRRTGLRPGQVGVSAGPTQKGAGRSIPVQPRVSQHSSRVNASSGVLNSHPDFIGKSEDNYITESVFDFRSESLDTISYNANGMFFPPISQYSDSVQPANTYYSYQNSCTVNCIYAALHMELGLELNSGMFRDILQNGALAYHCMLEILYKKKKKSIRYRRYEFERRLF